MPRFIGNDLPGVKRIERNAKPRGNLVRLTYSQARRLPPRLVRKSLDTTDRGSKGTYAKRWFRWYAFRSAILRSPRATANMLERAGERK